MKSLCEQIQQDGFALASAVLDDKAVDQLRRAAEVAMLHPLARNRRGSAYGLRNLFRLMPAAWELARSPCLLELVCPVLGPEAKPIKAILFDKTEHANWAVPWHQDVTIAVKSRKSVPGFDAWSEKDDIPHAQPPVEVLEGILALRIHLDPCPAENGALKVIPGSHACGRLGDEDVDRWRSTVAPVTCVANAGDVLLMRPLVLHSSAAATAPAHRRVLHFEYTAFELPGGLEWCE